jgi:hypothetical protein
MVSSSSGAGVALRNLQISRYSNLPNLNTVSRRYTRRETHATVPQQSLIPICTQLAPGTPERKSPESGRSQHMSVISHAPVTHASASPIYAQSTGAVRNEAHSSGVSWGAVIAGAFVAAALWLILLALGAGIGLSAISPWAGAGASGSAVSKGAIVWMILMEIISSAFGGYMAGRLRTKWVQIHTDEVFFRDTAHGFLVWAVALVLTAGFLTATATRLAGEHGGEAGASVARATEPNQYYVDAFLRNAGSVATENGTGVGSVAANLMPAREEVGVILANALRTGTMPDYDSQYLAQLISARTGLTPTDAQARVTQVFNEARAAADAARKATAHALYWLFLALLIGAFSASFAATVGGRQRDNVLIVG